jgi:hypothetical protein
LVALVAVGVNYSLEFTLNKDLFGFDWNHLKIDAFRDDLSSE